MKINTIRLICVGALIIFIFCGLYVPELRLHVPELRNDVLTQSVENDIEFINIYIDDTPRYYKYHVNGTYVETVYDTPQNSMTNVYYINGTNITDLEAHTQYLILNGDVYMKSFAQYQYFVFEEYNIVVIPNDEQPRFYFETLSIERCNEAILIGDNECYNHSYQKLHLFVEKNVAFTLQEYGYNYVIDLSNYTIVYD